MTPVMAEQSAERAALVLIANDRLPCRVCGKPHEWRLHNNAKGGTYADPDDEHVYNRMSPKAFAADVLSKTGDS